MKSSDMFYPLSYPSLSNTQTGGQKSAYTWPFTEYIMDAPFSIMEIAYSNTNLRNTCVLLLPRFCALL